MALSEGFKGLMSFITNGFTQTDSEDEVFGMEGNGIDEFYPPEVDGNAALEPAYKTNVRPARSFDKESNVMSHPNSYKSGEVTVIEPRSFSESTQIVKKLIDRKTVILHLDLLDKEQSQRTIDFVCGAAHALGGMAQKISDMVFIFTPSNVSLSVENGSTQSKFAESLWNKPL